MENKWIKILALFPALSRITKMKKFYVISRLWAWPYFSFFVYGSSKITWTMLGLVLSFITFLTEGWRRCIYRFAMFDSHCLCNNRPGLVCTKKWRWIFPMLIIYYHHNTTMDMWGLRCSRLCLQAADRQGFSRWEASFSAGEHVLGSPLPITEQ